MATPSNGDRKPIAILTQGFRPFFLFGALYAGVAMLIWLQVLDGNLALATAFSQTDWHSHEMLFGFAPAIVAGFLLTAIPNWTGRLPVRGNSLLLLATIWLCGRLAVNFSGQIGWLATALIDCGFLVALALVAMREIIAGKNWRNLKVLIPIGVLLFANALFHLEAHYFDVANYARRLGIAALIILIMLIGGRIIPSFTRNWLAREKPGKLPTPFNRYDGVTILVSVLSLASWTLAPTSIIAGAALILSAGLQLVRLSRWAGYRAVRNPLIIVLHIAYLFLVFGLCLSGLAALLPDLVPETAGVHAFGVGAVGIMMLSVMVRASLGHTGRPQKSGAGINLVFLTIILAGLVRICAALNLAEGSTIEPYLIPAAAYLWSMAFIGFAALFAKAMLTPRPDKKPR